MSGGRIVKLNVSPNPDVKIMTGTRYTGGIEVVGGTNGPPEPTRVTLHEETVIPAPGNVHLKKDGTPDLRFRNAPRASDWEKIKRGEWEAK